MKNGCMKFDRGFSDRLNGNWCIVLSTMAFHIILELSRITDTASSIKPLVNWEDTSKHTIILPDLKYICILLTVCFDMWVYFKSTYFRYNGGKNETTKTF